MRWAAWALMVGMLMGCPEDSPRAAEAVGAEESKPKVGPRPAVAAEPIAFTQGGARVPGAPDAQTAESPLTEEQKIERLIRLVAELEGATFIRNGEEHTGKEAAEHMRRKWQFQKDEIRTADDFIRLAATKSSTTGKPYVIRWADGREVKSGEFLREKLGTFNSG